MRLHCTADGDILDDWSDASVCNSASSCRHLSMARRHGHERRLQKLPQS